MKETTIELSSILSSGDLIDFDEDVYPVKFGGFLAQYVKPNPKDDGRPTEVGLVDVDGNRVTFDPDGDCLTLK